MSRTLERANTLTTATSKKECCVNKTTDKTKYFSSLNNQDTDAHVNALRPDFRLTNGGRNLAFYQSLNISLS